jgi:hypothetical protein
MARGSENRILVKDERVSTYEWNSRTRSGLRRGNAM